MRMFGVVALLLAVAALLVSVTKAEGHRHDEPGCACCSLDAEVVGTSDLSFESGTMLDIELADNIEITLKTEADHLAQFAMTAALRHEAGLRYSAVDLADVISEEDTLGVPASHENDYSPTEALISGDYLGDSYGREIGSGRFSGAGA